MEKFWLGIIFCVISAVGVFLYIRYGKHEVKDCSNCKFNDGENCTVGTHYAEQGRYGICMEGELHELKE